MRIWNGKIKTKTKKENKKWNEKKVNKTDKKANCTLLQMKYIYVMEYKHF